MKTEMLDNPLFYGVLIVYTVVMVVVSALFIRLLKRDRKTKEKIKTMMQLMQDEDRRKEQK